MNTVGNRFKHIIYSDGHNDIESGVDNKARTFNMLIDTSTMGAETIVHGDFSTGWDGDWDVSGASYEIIDHGVGKAMKFSGTIFQGITVDDNSLYMLTMDVIGDVIVLAGYNDLPTAETPMLSYSNSFSAWTRITLLFRTEVGTIFKITVFGGYPISEIPYYVFTEATITNVSVKKVVDATGFVHEVVDDKIIVYGSLYNKSGSAIGGAGVTSGPQSFGDNYVITPSVASNNLTLALKTVAGDDPSAGDPISFRIGDTKQEISSATSIVKNAATNWANLGSTELATQDVDLFAYVIQETGASAGTKVGWSRIGYGKTVADFSSTTTNEKYLAGPTNYNATDKVECIGRFNATLSAGAGYTWTIPATPVVINHPIDKTRWLTWAPVTSISAGSLSSTSYYFAEYELSGRKLSFRTRKTTTVSAGAGTTIYFTLPFEVSGSANNPTLGALLANDSAASYFGGAYCTAGTPDKASEIKYNVAAWAAGAGAKLGTTGFYILE